MPIINIPSAMRQLTAGESTLRVESVTLGEAIDRLDEQHPGLKARLVENGKLRAGLALFVNGDLPTTGLKTKLGPDDEVYFAPAIAGGASEG